MTAAPGGDREAAMIHPDEAEFVAKAAHELRTAIGGIDLVATALVDRMGEREVRDAQLWVLVRQLAQQSARVEEMAHQLLDLTRFGDGRADARRVRVQLAELLDEVLRADPPGPDRSIVIDVADDLVIESDPVALAQILTNLVRNAYRHGGGSIVLGGHVDDGRLVLHVADDGPGVPEIVRDRLFEPFVRGGPTEGNGLGLAIVAELALALSGDVDYEPVEPNGARFLVRLPLA